MSVGRIMAVPGDPPDPRALAEAAAILRGGGIVSHPTESCYGLAVDPWNAEAVGSLVALKGRDAGAGLILLVSSVEQAVPMIAGEKPEELLRRLAGIFWPGPLSIVVPASERVPDEVRGPSGGVAMRRSPDPVAARLPAVAGYPVTSTSANRSGEEPCTDVAEILECFGGEVDLLLDGGRRSSALPSTVVDLTRELPGILRGGAVPAAEVIRVLGGS